MRFTNRHYKMKIHKSVFLIFFIRFSFFTSFAQILPTPIGTKSAPENSEVSIRLVKRFQNNNSFPVNIEDIHDTTINSPKSVNILESRNKFYIHSLEGCLTSVYNLSDLKLIKTIHHQFTVDNQFLFHENTYFDYKFITKKNEVNIFKGKPVESCFSHNGKYLWVTYYRRSYDEKAVDPSAVCIIDTEADTIVRVMPTAPLPKMISCSPDNQTIAVTHWGDNSVGLIDISSESPDSFFYKKDIVIDYRMPLNFSLDKTVNRDQNCGHCLRGTVFTPDSKYILIGKMGSNSIAVVDAVEKKYIGSVSGMKKNMRHLLISNDDIYISINSSGFVQKAPLNDFVTYFSGKSVKKTYQDWKNVYVGKGARTIVVNPTGEFLFAAVNNMSKIAIVRTKDMKLIAECKADSYPVGMDISDDGSHLIVTAQGKSDGGGNSVTIYKVNYQSIN